MKFRQSAIEMFTPVNFGDGDAPEFPIDLIAPAEPQVVTCQILSSGEIVSRQCPDGFVCVDVGLTEDKAKTYASHLLEHVAAKARVVDVVGEIIPEHRRRFLKLSDMVAFRLSDDRVLYGPSDVFAMPCRCNLSGFVVLDIRDVAVISSEILIADVLFRLLDADLTKQMRLKVHRDDFSLAECSADGDGCPVFYDECSYKHRRTNYYCWVDTWRPITTNGQVRFEQAFQVATEAAIPVISSTRVRELIRQRFIDKYAVDGRQYQILAGEVPYL